MPPSGPDPFWETPEWKKVWDVDHLSDEEEMLLGKQLHDAILTIYPEEREDGRYQDRIRLAAGPLEKAVGRKSIQYTYTILDSDEVNAFSHLGGFVYITRGMFTAILGEDPDDDAALQFLLAHEIAHVDLGHMRTCLQALKSTEMGTLKKACLIVLPFGYLPDHDRAADRWAYDQMERLDRSRYERLKYLRKFVEYAKAHRFLDRRRRQAEGARPHRHAHRLAGQAARPARRAGSPVGPGPEVRAMNAADAPRPTST